MAEPWPVDGDAGICPDCNDSIHYATPGAGSHGTWFHDDGQEDCNA